MTPSKESQTVVVKTPVGSICIRGDQKLVHQISFLKGKTPTKVTTKPTGALLKASEWIKSFFRHEAIKPFPRKFISLDQGSLFEKKVWKKLGQIQYGQVDSYKGLAKKVGSPRAARAVGNALSKNPFPLIIPCHRIISTDGSLGGFTGGISIKRKLLRHEKSSLISK